MDSPSRFPATPGMPIFPVSPERVAGTKPPYNGPTPGSPSPADNLRTSPIRRIHRRNDSDASVHGLAAMFENLEVKDLKEAQARYLKSLDTQKAKHTATVNDMERKHAQALARHEMRMDELSQELKKAKEALKDSVARAEWDKLRQDFRERESELVSEIDKKRKRSKALEKTNQTLEQHIEELKTDLATEHENWRKATNESLKVSGRHTTLLTELNGTKRDLERAKDKAEHQERLAGKYEKEVFSLEVKLVGVEEELKKLQDRVKAVEEERDALKTNLKEEEVLRIAAEGRIPLPATTTDENDEFASPVRSPRKPRNAERDDDKENVAPKKSPVELRMLQRELEIEKCLRERAEAQIDFMKMECQFGCCSCRLADLKGSKYTHDDTCAGEMERIKSTIPLPTPPPSRNSDRMEDVKKEEESEDVDMKDVPEKPMSRPSTPPTEQAAADAEEPIIAFSPETGTFRAVPSPEKTKSTRPSTSGEVSSTALVIAEPKLDSSPWAPAVESTIIRPTVSPPPFREIPRQIEVKPDPYNFPIHEDAIDDEEEEDMSAPAEPQTPVHHPGGMALPHYFTRTITTTTTIPLHFSPVTPHANAADKPLTPSTIAHMPTNSAANPLGDLSMNQLPFDRAAAIEQIRQRRGRARSMAAGQGTPGKQMLEGVARRDISAPVHKMKR